MSTATSDLVFEAAGHRRSLVVRRHSKSRGLRLRVDPRDGRVLLTLPKRANLKNALAWAEAKRDWIETELARIEPPQPIAPGAMIPFRGEGRLIDWSPSRPRKVRIADDRLIVGGPEEGLSGRVLRWLKAQARMVLAEETQVCARRAGVSVARVGIGDARSRWGSCAASGTIRYSWRLIMAPADVLSATVAHEVAHRVHMHHGPEFHALVTELFGRDPSPERQWLREHGTALYRVGSS